MKQKILPLLAVTATLLASQSHAQKNTAFAVTAQTKGSYTWNVVREIDLSTGEVLRTVYDPSVNKVVNYASISGEQLRTGIPFGAATGSGVAAAAFDAVHNRLYFTNMRGNDLMYFDFASKDVSVVVNNNPAFNTGNKNEEGNVITRMAFASDGYGYAITNDGKSLIRFTTDKTPVVTNLGALSDDKKNGTMSIHSQSSSWGGDMVGDAYGNLYIITYRNHLFKLNPQTRVTEYLGQLTGLPEQFTSNGMVVNNDGDLIISSATLSDNYYKVNISTLKVSPIDKKDDKVFNASDLANANLLYDRKLGIPNLPFNSDIANNLVTVYPNPAVNKTFNLQFDKLPAGKYNLQLSDASGKNVLSRALVISVRGQVEKVLLPRATGSGVYLVRLTGGDKKDVLSQKIVVQ